MCRLRCGCAALALALAALTAAPLAASADDPAPGAPVANAAAPPATAPGLAERFVALRINGTTVAENELVLADASGAWYVTGDDARAWRLDLSHEPQPLLRDGTAYLRLDAFGTVFFDEPTQTLRLVAPPASFVVTELHKASTEPSLAPGAGGYLDYDVVQSVGGANRELGAFFDAGYGRDGALADQTFALASGNVVRLETLWRHDLPAQQATFVLGDATSHAGALGDAVRFAGIQYATNFATDPNFITEPTLALGGSAALPSTVDVYLNGSAQSRSDVPAGPFAIQDLAIPSGAGTLQLHVTDALGRSQVIDVPFYGTPSLLRRGLCDVAYEAGFLRLDYATQSDRYGPLFTAMTLRRGMSDALTVEGHVEAGDDAALATADGELLLGRGGVLSAGFGASASPFGGGELGSLGYDYTSRDFAVGGQMQLAHDAVRVGQPDGMRVAERSLGAHLSFALGAAGRLGGSVVSVQRAGLVQTVAVANYTASFRRATLTASLVRTGRTASSFLTLQVPLGSGGGVSLEQNDEDTARSTGFDLYGSRQAGLDRISYDLHARDGASAALDGSAQLSTPLADVEALYQDGDGSTLAQLEVRGAVTFAGGAVAPTREVLDGYGIVEVPGYPGVAVSVDGNPAGRTDRDGRLIVSGLTPYRDNTVTLDPGDLPIAANVSATSGTIAPYYRTPGVLRFAATPAGGVLATLVHGGKLVGAGATVTLHGSTTSWPVGDAGRTFLAGLAVGPAHFDVSDDSGAALCSFRLTIPPNAGDLPDLGSIECS